MVDPQSNETIGAALALDRGAGPRSEASSNRTADALRSRSGQVRAAEREARSGHAPRTIWLTGLPRAGKTTLAYALERALFDRGAAVCVLDGENLRLGLSADLGFGADDRGEQARRSAHVARLVNDVGLIAIVALVSPRAADRAVAREIVGEERFVEVFVDAPEVCAARDGEGLYQRAERGEIPRFTGVSADYEPPASPALRLRTAEQSVAESLAELLRYALPATRQLT